jgi:hypothetical protein
MSNVKVRLVGDKRVMRDLKKLDERVRKKVLKKTARKALKPVVRLYKSQITDSDEVFAVYRNGSVYAEIIPGQLRKSIAVKFPKQEPGVDGIVASVGPRKTGAYRHPEKGGWFAGFISFGWLRFRDGSKYNGQNFGWAANAIRIGERFATPRIKMVFGQYLGAEIKKLGFGQKMGMR